MWNHQEEEEILPGLSIREMSVCGHAERRSAIHKFKKSHLDSVQNIVWVELLWDWSVGSLGSSSNIILRTAEDEKSLCARQYLCCAFLETSPSLPAEIHSTWWDAGRLKRVDGMYSRPVDSSETQNLWQLNFRHFVPGVMYVRVCVCVCVCVCVVNTWLNNAEPCLWDGGEGD